MVPAMNPRRRVGRALSRAESLTGGAFSCPRQDAAIPSALMIDDLDILRAANILVKRYGADAAIEAARRADELLEAGDMDGCAIWKRILAALGELTRTTPAEGERVN